MFAGAFGGLFVGVMSLAVIIIYGVIITALVIFVRAVVRISHSFERIGSALDEIASAQRARNQP
jgi:hypothetical protein